MNPIDIVVAVLIVAFVAAAWMRSVLDIGGRAWLQRRWIGLWARGPHFPGRIAIPGGWTWSTRRTHIAGSHAGSRLDLRREVPRRSAIYSLHYTQVCALVGDIVQDYLGQTQGTSPFVQRSLVVLLTTSAAATDILTWLTGEPATATHQDADTDSVVDASRQRLATVVERNLDQLQASLGLNWIHFTHASSYALVGILIVPLAPLIDSGQPRLGLPVAAWRAPSRRLLGGSVPPISYRCLPSCGLSWLLPVSPYEAAPRQSSEGFGAGPLVASIPIIWLPSWRSCHGSNRSVSDKPVLQCLWRC